MSGSYKFRGENPWHNFHKLHVPEDVNFSNHANSWYSQSNGSNRNKESMGYGGLAYYDNATYAGPHSKGSFTGGSSDHPDYTYRRTKNRCCIAIGVLVLILAVGIGVFLGVYFGLMDKPDTVSDTSQYEKGKFQTSLKINQNWDPKYGDPNSPEYQGLINNLDNQLTSMYQSSSIKNDFQRVDVTSVSQGSINVVCIIVVAQTSQLTPSVLQSVTRASIEQIQNDASSTSALLKAVDVSLISVSSVPLTTTLLPPTTTQAKTSTMAKTTEKPTTEAVTSTIKQTTTEKHTTPPPMTTAPQPPPSTTPPPPPSTTTPPTTTPDPITAPPPSPTTAPPPPPTTAPPPPPSTTTPPTTTPEPTTAPPPQPSTTTPPTTTPEPTTAPPPPSSTTTPPTTTPELTTVPPPPPTTTTPPTTTPESTTAPPPPPSTTTPPTTTTGAAVTQPHTTMELSTDLTTKKTFLDGNPCTNHGLLRDISLQCFGNFANDLMTESTNDGKCNVLLGKVLPCIVTKIQTDYGKTCTKKEQHNIIIENRDTIKNVVTFDPQLCLPTPSCSSIESIVYYVPIVCEEQTNELVKSGSCSDFSDVLKCYYYHIGSSCNTTDLYSSISNSYTQWSQMIGQPFPNSCSVSIDWIDSSAKTSLCSDPDAVQVIVNMYCPNDLLEFIMAGTAEKCMKANNLVVCAENQMNLVLKTSCIVDDIYNVMAGYQSNITGVSNQPSIIDCHHRQEQTTDEMTTTAAATTTATIVIVEGEFEANMKVNQTWDPVFEDKNSTEYKDLTENFRNQTLALYNYKNSTVQVEDIVVLDVSEGSLVFDFLIILVKTLPDIAEWTAEKLIEKTVEIIETIQKDPEVVLDIIKNVDTKKIKVNQKVEKLTECDRVGYIKPIVQDRCNNALTRLFQVPDNQTRCKIFEQVVGCVVFHAQQCSVAKVTRTISKHFNAMKSSVPNAGQFEPSTCYANEEDLVLPTLMPLTAQVKPCIHPDVLSYIMNFDCHYDAIPHMTKENATMEENCRFYWMTAACVYQKAQENQLLQSFGQCSFEETKQVLVNYADKIFKVRPTTSAAQCYAYMFKKEECSTYLYVPDMYNSFGICFMEWFQLKLGMRGDFDLSNMTCRMYKEAAQCLYRHYQIKGNNSCNWRDFGKNAAWMINSGIAQWSQAMNVKMNEADDVEYCIDEATSDSDFGHSICVDGEALILSSTECISQTLMKAEGGVCQSLKNHYIPCVQSKIPPGLSCTRDDIEQSIMMEANLIEKLTRKTVVISQCTGDKDKASNMFNITMTLMMDWSPVYGDVNSVEYQNLTSEFLRQLNIAVAEFASMIEYMKVVDVRSGSVVIVTEVKYTFSVTGSNILLETQKFVSDAKMNPNSTLTLLSIVDMNSIQVDAYDVGPGDYCMAYREEVMNVTTCGMAMFGFLNRSDIDQQVLCSAYNTYLSCLKIHVERSGKTCKMASLNSWIPITLSYYLTPGTVEQVGKCQVDDDNKISCDDTGLLEQMALRSACAGYAPYLNHQECSAVWQPYVKCVADLFPSCDIRDVAEKLVSHTNISNLVPSGFDVMDKCFPDGLVLEESSLFSITLKLMIDWVPELMDKDSDRYRNLTTEIMREMEMAAAAANYTDMIDYMKIIEVRQGSVIVEFEVRYIYVIKTTDIMSGTQQLVMGVKQDPDTPLRYLKTVDMDSISVKALKDSKETDYCGVYRDELINSTECGTAMYGFMNRTSIPQHELCGAYDVYLMCIRESVEKRGLTCKLTSLHKWVPYTFPYYLQSVTVEQVNKCDVDDDNKISCDDTGLLEQMALRSACAGYAPYLNHQECSAVWQPYVKCVADLFPSCDIRDVAEKLVSHTNISNLVPSGFDVMDKCFPDGPVLEESSLFSITLKFMIDWVPDLMDKDSDRYRNLTTEIMREMEMAAAAANYTDMIDYMKIMEVRQGSVIVEFEVRYNYVIKTTDIMSGTQQLVMGAKQDPDTPLRYLKTVDMDSISVKALKDGTEMDYCGVYREDILNNTQCVTAIYGLMDRTSISQHELCGAYDVYLMCIRERVEKRGLKCKLTSLHKWVPQTFQYYLQSVSVDQVNKCDVDDDNTISCDDTGLLEQMALRSVCGMYTPHLYSQDCSNVWQPYVKCVADLFPSCNIRDVAEKLVHSTNISHMVAPGFDVVNSCFSDGSVLVESSLFSITLKFMIDWLPELMDKDSNEYRNLTTEIMREMEMAAAAANYTDMIDYMKIIEVRQGSVIVEFEVRYNYVIKTTDIMSGTQQLVMGAKQDPDTPMRYLKTVDMDSITVKALKDGTEMDYCGVYREDILNNTQCVTAIYGFMDRTSIPQHELCGAYDVYLMCIRERVEKRGLKCKLTSLHKWVPQTFQYYLQSVSVDQVNKCDVDDDNKISCDDTGLLEQMALRSVCGMYTPHLYSQDCSNVWQPYVKCVADLFPSCNIRDVAEKLVHSTKISHMVAPGFDVVNRCFSGDASLDKSNIFRVTFKLMIDWIPDYSDENSTIYQNLTEALTREMYLAASMANYSMYLDYIKVVALRQGSVYVVYELKYIMVIHSDDVISGAQYIINMAKMDPNTPLQYITLADINGTTVEALKGDVNTGYCSMYKEEIMNNTRCGMALYGFMNRSHVGQSELCQAYNIYVTCLKETVERSGQKCDLAALHGWVSTVVSVYVPTPAVSNINQCPLVERGPSCDVDDLEAMAFQSACAGYTIYLSYPMCSLWMPYIQCIAGMFPQCSEHDVADKLMSTNVSALVPPGFDVMDTCFQDKKSASKYRISMKFDIMWIPMYHNPDSEAYRNLTGEIMSQMMMAVGNYSDTITKMEIVDLRPGSVIVVFEVEYAIPIDKEDIRQTSVEIVMAARMMPGLYLIHTVDATSIVVEALDDGLLPSGYDCTQYNQQTVEINPACSASMAYLYNRTSITPEEICRSYDVALTCVQQSVEIKTMKDCKKTDLHTWMPFVIQGALPNIKSSQLSVCPVTNEYFYCNNTELFESYALGACYSQFTQILQYPMCGEVWVPYINCTAGLFPQCPIKAVAESLMDSPKFTSIVPKAFDVLDTCFPDNELPSYMVSLRFEMPWKREFEDEDSEEYRNLTSEVMRQMMIATANYTDMMKDIKIYEVREGSVIIVLEVQLFQASSESDVQNFVADLVWSIKKDSNSRLHLLKLIDPYRIEIDEVPDWLKDDVCEHYRQEILIESGATCGLVLYGLANQTDDIFCTSYDVYMTCIKDREEEKWHRECKKSSLNQWLPIMIHSFLPQIPIEKYGMCNVTRDIDVCTDVPSVSVATLHSVCAFPFLFLHMAPTCNATVGAFNCVMSILPSCDPIQVITTMKKSSNMSALIPPSLDPEDCYRDICENYTDLVEEDKDCIDIFIDSASPYDVQCRRYNVYAHCLLNSIRKQGRVCEMDSLLTWLPDYLEMRQNVSDLQNCSLTRGSLCYDLGTIETVARDSQCRDRNHLLSIYPSCLNAKMLIKCMMGILGDCNNYTLANILTMSNHSLVPSSLDLNHCLRAPGFDLFQVNFTINTTWTDELHDWNSTEYRKLADTITQQAMDLFTNEKLNLFKQIAKVEIIGFSQGSVKVHSQIMIDYDSPFYRTLTAEDLKQEMTMAIDWLQSFAPSKPNYFTSVDPQSIEVWGIGEPDRHMTTPYQPYPTYPTTVTTTITPSCSSPAYIKLVIGYCESAKSQLQKSLFKSSNITCRILFDLIGCVMFNTKFMCSEQEIMSVIESDPYGVLEHYLDTSSCYAPGSDIILPTILPLNMSLSPCSSPDVIKYILNYDCYYYAVMDSLQGTSQIESCKFYWYSTSCVYKAIEGSTTLPRCSHSEIMDVFTKYETQLFQVSPANVDLKYCTENGEGTCSKSMFGPKFYEVAMTCYGNALSNRYLAMYYALNIDKDKCLIYEEMYECMYRALRNNCSKAEMEREGIWITNTFNNVMTVAMGQNLKEKETVFECIANSSNKDSFGQDICYDGPGLIMNSVNCALEIMDCRSLMDKYLPCMVNALATQGIRCDKHVLVSSVLKESALLSRLISHVGDLSGCGKDGICPSVSNSSDSHGNQSFCEILCSDDFSCPYNEKCCSNGCGAYCLTPEAKTTMMPYTPATSVFTTVKGKEAAFVVSIPFNLPWDQAYDDENSDTYRNLASMISTEMYSMVGGVPGLRSLNVTGFRNGSVIADILVIFSQALYTADEVYYETMHAIKDLLPNSTLFQKVIFEKVSVVPYRDPSAKEGSCPAVVGSGICLYNCSSDQQCGGPQKCCFNGCGYVCVDPVSGKSSDRFNVSLVFDIPWDDVYKQNETYKAAIVNEIYTMIGNNSISSYIKSVEAKVIKPGSVIVFLEVQFWKVLEAYEVEQQLEMMIQAVQWVPMFPWLQKVRSVKVNSLPAWNNIVTMTPPTSMITTTMNAPDPTPSPPPVQPMCQGSWGSCLSNTDCHLVKWSYNYGLQTIVINITAAVGPDKWLGVGFNKEKKMLDADAIIGWLTPEGTVVVSDRKNGPYFYPLIDTNQNVNNVQGYRIGGITSISFTRNRITDDGTDDFAFNATNGAYFLFPLGGNYSSDGTIFKHDRTPAISADMFTFPCPEVCKDLQFFRMWAPRMCAKEVSSFKETDDQLTFCRNLGLTSECIQRNMPLHGCSSEIEESVYITLIGLLNELIPFDIMPKVSGCIGG